jgi:hypothetical protein
MSHVVSLNFYIDDLDCLETACKNLGLELRRGQKEYKWFGEWGRTTTKTIRRIQTGDQSRGLRQVRTCHRREG